MRSAFPAFLAVCALLVLGPVGEVSAQDDRIDSEGTWGLRFSVSDGIIGGVGGVYLTSNRTSLGLNIGMAASSRYRESDLTNSTIELHEDSHWLLRLTPELR